MGYKPAKKKVFRLTFSQFEGLEIMAIAPPIGELMDIAELRLNLNEAAQRRMEVFNLFAKRIKVWNLEHPEPEQYAVEEGQETEFCARCGLSEGDPMPTTAEAMMCLELDFIMAMFFGWLATVSRVDPPKEMNLNIGGSNTHTDLMRQLAELQNPMPLREPNLS